MKSSRVLIALMWCSALGRSLSYADDQSQSAQVWVTPLTVQVGSSLIVQDTATLKVDVSIAYPPSLQQAKFPPGVTLPSGYKQTQTSALTQSILLTKNDDASAPQLKATILLTQSTDSNAPPAGGTASRNGSPLGPEGGPATPNQVLDIDCASVVGDAQPGESDESRFRRADCTLFAPAAELGTFLNALSLNASTPMPKAVAQRLLPAEVAGLGVDPWLLTLVRLDPDRATFALSGSVQQTDAKSFAKFTGSLTINSQATNATVDLQSKTQSSEALPDGSVIQSAGSMSINAARVLTVK
jgi:hypothetical protein